MIPKVGVAVSVEGCRCRAPDRSVHGMYPDPIRRDESVVVEAAPGEKKRRGEGPDRPSPRLVSRQ